MADGQVRERGGHRPPYGAVLALTAWAVHEWPSFNGWCIAHGIHDPRTLRADRLVDLVYYLRTRNLDAKQRATFDRSLVEVEPRTTIPRAAVPNVDRRSLPPPSWWKGDEHATQLGAEMMRRLDRVKQ